MSKVSKEQEQLIIQHYNDGLSMAKVGKKFGISATTVLHILERNNIPRRTKGGIYKIPEEDVIKRYTEGESCQSIADLYKVNFHTISNILESFNIPRDNRYHNIDLDIHYFSSIDSYDKAYFLGFLITDGSVNLNDNTVSLGLSNKDKDILKTFSQKTKNTNKLYERKDKNETYFKVKCKQWKEDLSRFGVVPQKTSKVYLPFLEEKFMPHLLRGLFDGDGWISEKSHQIGFCGNETLVTQVHDFLVKTLDVYNVKILKTQPHLWQITWASEKDIIKIGKYLYQDKQDCFLQRKFMNFEKIQGNTEITD